MAQHGLGLNVGLKGEGGVELREYWKSLGGPQAYLGVAVPSFPNHFTVIGPNAASTSWGFTIGVKTLFIARLVKAMVDNNLSSIQPKQEPFERLNAEIQSNLALSTTNSTLCSNWFRIGGKGLHTVHHWTTGCESVSLRCRASPKTAAACYSPPCGIVTDTPLLSTQSEYSRRSGTFDGTTGRQLSVPPMARKRVRR